MRKLRQIGMAVVLTLALATCGFAGIIGTMPEAPPPAPEPGITSSLGATIAVTLIQIAVR